jgi:hypothetical protein
VEEREQRQAQFQRGVRAMMGLREYRCLQVLGAWMVHNPETRETYCTASGGRSRGDTLSAAGCSCPDHQHRCREQRLRCKHQIALRLFRESPPRDHFCEITPTPREAPVQANGALQAALGTRRWALGLDTDKETRPEFLSKPSAQAPSAKRCLKRPVRWHETDTARR